MPETIDGRVRAMALMAITMKQRKEAKELISQKEIQEKYFELLEYYFGDLYKEMKEAGIQPRELASVVANHESNLELMQTVIPSFMEAIEAFWEAVHYSSWLHEEDSHKSKAIHGGDMLPPFDQNIASQLGLYMDTIIIFDPFQKLSTTMAMRKVEDFGEDVIRFALTLIDQYKPLALADVNPPIVVITAERFFEDESYTTFLMKESREDTTKVLSLLFGQDFNSHEDANEFLKDFENAEKLLNEAKNTRYLIFESGDPRPLTEQFLQFLEMYVTPLGLGFSLGESVSNYIFGRMIQANALIDSSRGFQGTPVLHAETSWDYFNIKLELGAKAVGSDQTEKLHISRGLNRALGGELEWIGKIPIGSLIELRKQGATEEIKSIIANDINQLVEADASNFKATSQQVIDNLQAAFRDHEAMLKELQRKHLKFFGLDVTLLLVRGGISLAAAKLHPAIPLVASMAGLPSLKDVGNKALALNKERDKLDRTPVGMLLRAKR